MPFPLLLAPPVIAIQDESLLANHPQEAAAVTEMELEPVPVPDAGNDTFFGDTARLQFVLGGSCGSGGSGAAPASCVMFIDWFATTTDAERIKPEFGPTEKLTLPVPVPVVPAVMTTHDASARAVHAQPLAAVTLMVPLPPDDVNV